MALFGVIFALGAGSAAAQDTTPPTVTGGNFDPGAMTITLTANELVYGSPPGSAFTVMVTPLGGTAAANVVTAVTPIPQLSPSTTIMLTLTTAIQTGSTVAVTYTPAAPATPGAATNQIRDIAGNALAAIATSPAIGENDQVPAFTQVADMSLELNKRISPPIELPEATRGNQPFTYTLELTAATGTPTGVTINTGAISNTGTTGGNTDPGFRFLASPPTLLGTPSVAGVYTLTYTVVDDSTVGTAQTIPQTFMITVAAAPPPPPPTTGGQITEFKLVGAVSEKTIAGTERYHVTEGSQAVELSVTVQWTHAEIAAIGYNMPQEIHVEIKSDRPAVLPNWLSWIDGEGDVHFPRAGSLGNLTGGVVTVRTPRESQVPASQRGSGRHVKSATGKLSVLILHDDHEAENDAFYIEAVGGDVDLEATAAVNRVTPEVVIEDDEDQKVTVKKGSSSGPTSLYEPAGSSTIDSSPAFTVAASPARVDLPLEVRLDMVDLADQTVSAALISLSKSSMTLNANGDGTGNSDTVEVNLPDSDGNRVDDDYKLKASVNVYSVASGGYRTIPVAEHAIMVIDRHKLPTLMVSPAMDTVMEGGMVELTLTINRNPSNTTVSTTEQLQYTQEEVTVMLSMGAGSTATAADYSMMPNSVTFPARTRGSYTSSMMLMVEAMADDELDDMEMLVLDAEVAGGVAANGTEKDMHMGVSTLTIEEGTMKYVWPKSDEEIQAIIYAAKDAGMGDDMMFNPGEMIEIESAAALFNAAEGVTLSYSAMSDNEDVATVSVSGAMVTVMAGDMPGVMAHITITAHASMPSGAKGLPQTDPREASVKFPVEVGLAALSIMLTGPDDMNLVEGGMGGMVTATANRMVTEDVTVMLMRDRAMSSADDMDFEAEPIMIMAGEMMGTTMVMAVEDDMMETVDNMPEELVLYGMTEGMAGEVMGEVKFYLWDAAVPALPIIAQLLLAAFLAIGGYRRYRRR